MAARPIRKKIELLCDRPDSHPGTFRANTRMDEKAK